MTPEFKAQLEAAAESHAMENGSIHLAHVDVTDNFKSGSAWTVDAIVAWLRSDEAKAVKHCSDLHRKLFGQTAEVFADEIQHRFGREE